MAIPTYVKPMLIPALIGAFLILSAFVFMDFYSDPVSSSAQPDNRICQTTSVTETATIEFKFQRLPRPIESGAKKLLFVGATS